MKHSRSDYQGRIVDLKKIIPEDEPVFLLRGQDLATPAAVRAWAQAAINLRADREVVIAAQLYAREIEDYQRAIGGGKVPDCPAGHLTGSDAGTDAGTGAGNSPENPPQSREDGYPPDWSEMDVARHKNAGLVPPDWHKDKLDKWFKEHPTK